MLQELLAMQQNGPRDIGFFGTRNMGFMHQQLIEVLSYAMVLTVGDAPSEQSLHTRMQPRNLNTGFEDSLSIQD